MLKSNSGKSATRLNAHIAQFTPFLHNRGVVLWTDQYYHITKVLRGGSHQCDAADVNLLQRLGERGVLLSNRLGKGIKVYHDDVDRDDTVCP